MRWRVVVLVAMAVGSRLGGEADADGSVPVEVFQVAAVTPEALPGGKEADGIVGDWVLRNDRIEVLIAAPGPDRHAHLTSGPTSGVLLDATQRGARNDQFGVLFTGGRNWVMDRAWVVDDGIAGTATLRLVKEATSRDPLLVINDYSLRAGEEWLKITTRLENRGSRRLPQIPMDLLRLDGLYQGPTGDLPLAYGYDPYERAAYGLVVRRGTLRVEVQQARRSLLVRYPVSPRTAGVLEPGEALIWTRYFLIGQTPADLLHLNCLLRGEPVGALHGLAVDQAGEPVSRAQVFLSSIDRPGSPLESPLLALTDLQGRFRAWLPPGRWRVRVESMGRSDGEQIVSIEAGRTCRVYQVLSPQTRFVFRVRDERGQPLPCKVQFIGVAGTATPEFGPPERAEGAGNVVLSADGAFTRPIPPGTYLLIISRGVEYDAVTLQPTIAAGETQAVEVRLWRTVNTSGWVAADLHSHTTESGDNTTGVPDRIISHAAEGVEFIPATDHNRLVDWEPVIRRLGLAHQLKTAVGIESTGVGPHLNIFPLTTRPFTQDNGAPPWDPDPRVTAQRFREAPPAGDRYVQLNHPDMGAYFNDRDADGKPDGGFEGLAGLLDGVELYATGVLAGEGSRAFHWLQFLNRGHRYAAVGNTDAHHVHHDAGFPRNYIRSSTDKPADIQVEEMVRELKARHVVVTNGPFLEARLNGAWPGDDLPGVREGKLWVRVQCPNWFDVDRVQILLNGRPAPDLNFTRATSPQLFRSQKAVRFEHTMALRFESDTHVIVVAIGEGFNLGSVGGPSRTSEPPVAITNPFFVDPDANGWQPNGDPIAETWPVGRQ